MKDARYWIRRLKLRRHPEGGFYRETYRSRGKIPGADRSCATAIYFLLERGDCSAWHRIKSDELWMLHAGGPLVIHVIGPAGRHRRITLGLRPGQTLQAVVPAGSWFGAETARGASFALVTCVVAPGFDFADFELADCVRLAALFPRHRKLIARLARAPR